MTESQVMSANPATNANAPKKAFKKTSQSSSENSSRPDNPAYVAFEAKRSGIDKRIEAIRAQMVNYFEKSISFLILLL